MIFFKPVFFQTILLFKEVEFNEILHKLKILKINIYSFSLSYLTKNLLWDCKYNLRNIFWYQQSSLEKTN